MAAQGTNERVRPRGMRIGGRLVLLLAIPLVALLGITGYGVSYGTIRSAEASRLQDRTDLGMLTQRLIGELQQERRTLISEGRIDGDLRGSIESTAGEVRSRAAELGGPVGAYGESAGRKLDALDRVAGASLGGRVALRNYSLAIVDLLELSSAALDPRGEIDDAAASTVDYLARSRAASAEEHDLLVHLSGAGSLDAEAFQQLTALASAQERYASLAAAAATSQSLEIRIERVTHRMRAADVIRRNAFGAFDSGRDQVWRDGLTARTGELETLQDEASVIAGAEVDDLARSSRLLLVGAALSAIAIVLVSAYLLRRAVRTIARPLQDLALQAEDVARTRLPDAVAAQQQHGGEELHLPALRATGAAEVHEVAAAFNDVQDTALRLAGEQAALRLNQGEALTNLGRRNQTLLARQLDFISSLETRETDPVFLEHLFKLDHLASRMRRNAESLLILAGSETPRRRRTPAPVTEVVRAAMSEVEEFERVRIGHLRDATVAGPAVIDLVHLLAELIENALNFSPPETTVEIDGRPLGQGGYQFAVIDRGVGMAEVELLAANQRMEGTDELEGMPTRYLGQYVVAKLATKVGAMVRLQRSSGGRGVTATVNLPAGAMLGSPDRSAVARPMPGSRAAREQGPEPFAPGAGVSDAARAAALEGGWSEQEWDEDPWARPGELDEPVGDAEPIEASGEPVASEFDWSTIIDGTHERDADDGDRHGITFPEADPEPVVATRAVDGAEPHLVDARDLVASQEMAADRDEDLPSVLPGLDPVRPTEVDDPWTSVTPDPATLVPPPVPHEVPAQPQWTPATAMADEPSLPPTGRSGGLARRVPGASLAERQGAVALGEGTEVPERSATEVRSMLSSFQAGRDRGRDGSNPDDVPDVDSDTAAPLSDDAVDALDDTTDWRSTT